MKSLMLLFLLTIAFQCSAQKNEAMWQGAALIITDWSTTRNMTYRYNEDFFEKGLIASKVIGNKPTREKVDLYFITRLAIHYAVYKSDLSSSDKHTYYYVTIADHGSATINNLTIGLKMKF